jgi:opacity protein-like surface antigen
MSNRRTVSRIAALMAGFAIIAISAAPAAGQAGPAKKVVVDTSKKPTVDTSATRIKIQKRAQKAGGEVCLPEKCVTDQEAIDRAVGVERDASLVREQKARDEQARLDSVAMALQLQRMQRDADAAKARARIDSIARAESAEREAQLAMKRHLSRGFYLGLAGGASMPQRDIRNGYTGGWNTMLPFGWDANDSPLGFRTDFSVDHLNGTRVHDQNAVTTAASGDLTVWSLNADLKLRMHAPGAPSRTNVYALGGVGAHRVVNGVYGSSGPNAGQSLGFSDAKTNFGWNVGAGVSTAWGPTELFVESRFFHVKTDLGYHMNGGVGTYTSFTPIVIGLQWF